MNRRGLILGALATPLLARSGILMPVSGRFEVRRFELTYEADNPRWVVPPPLLVTAMWDKRSHEYTHLSSVRLDGSEGGAWGSYDRCYARMLT